MHLTRFSTNSTRSLWMGCLKNLGTESMMENEKVIHDIKIGRMVGRCTVIVRLN